MKRYSITDAEWQVLEALWLSPASLMELVRYFEERPPHWSKSTIATLLRRLEEKSLVSYHTEGKTKVFYAQIERDDALRDETHALLEKVFSGSLGLLVNTLVQHDGLSSEELDELYAILCQAEETQDNVYNRNK